MDTQILILPMLASGVGGKAPRQAACILNLQMFMLYACPNSGRKFRTDLQ